MWIPLDRKSVNCRGFLEVCYVGAVYVDALKKEWAKRNSRQAFGIEPHANGGTFERGLTGSQQLAIDFYLLSKRSRWCGLVCRENL